LSNITLRTEPIYEDTDIRIRATRKFKSSENGDEEQTDLLDVILPLKVRANPALPVSIDPMSVIDYDSSTIVKIANTQQSVHYQLCVRPILDREFVHGEASADDVIRISVEGEHDTQVLKPDIRVERKTVLLEPASEGTWVIPEGYAESGSTQKGTGGDLELDTQKLTEDSLVVVQARKIHEAFPETTTGQVLSSSLELAQPAAILVRPDPKPPLRVEILAADADTSVVQILDGQPGVFYYFRRTSTGAEFERPAYFHKRDDENPSENKGVGKLKLDIDFVVAADRPPGQVDRSANLAEIPPVPPQLQTSPLQSGTALHVRAVKAQTRVGAPLYGTVAVEER
jgi:hypothetical protein